MTTIEIDRLTTELYNRISFKNSAAPDIDIIAPLFYGGGALVNNSFNEPIAFTITLFIDAMQGQVADGTLEEFTQREMSSETEIFGKIAHRTSVYEYSYDDIETGNILRGINYIQFIYIEGSWRIVSMIWSDENETNLIPDTFYK